MQLSFNRMTSDQAAKTKRALVSLLNSLYDLGQLPRDVVFKFLDRKISPVLLYGSEIWGFAKRESVELSQSYACKRYMCFNLRACNAAVLGSCDFYHIWAWRLNWSCDLNHLNKLSFPHPMDAPHEIWLQLTQQSLDQDQDSLLVKRRNDNHSPGPVIGELVPSSHQRSELRNTILCIFSR